MLVVVEAAEVLHSARSGSHESSYAAVEVTSVKLSSWIRSARVRDKRDQGGARRKSGCCAAGDVQSVG